MAHAHTQTLTEEQTRLPARVASLAPGIIFGGLVLILAALGWAFATEDGLVHFQYAYLTGFMAWLMVALGSLIFLCLQHVFRAGWSVGMRRIPEMIVSNFWPWIIVAFMPIFIPICMGDTTVYKWLDPAMVNPTSPLFDQILANKSGYLNKGFFIGRLVAYFGIWTLMARFFVKNSVAQDADGDPARTRRMEMRAAPLIMVFALSLTFAGFDLLMSLDPHWFSTIWGVYLFAGCMISSVSSMILLLMFIQNFGGMKHIGPEQYSDLGKLLFAFVFFWGYIAFSQYMLIWYANIPEETTFFHFRQAGEWANFSLLLLFGHLLLPFPGLLSRHIKRGRKTLAFWAIWMLVFHFVDFYWMVMPYLAKKLGHGMEVVFHPMDVLIWLGLGLGLFGLTLSRAKRQSMVPLRDPRLPESLAFENYY
ncbi:quinol:cytochrome C oxidoreductase [Engelhardtia mirabilis]|uniref:Quinol:cytochrome C oxidoreductase n=1 Tax=Engelhardtia mirabilis TaxID=2528011 RepID=A0A518BH14_9BACT|nr:hypothetical protein Pla133_13380 [Planctomycetes bacterium Pla133]QDV00597.1 hypothetical protein Pla86_13370 [Planctomycetes bacterium Pla86]